MEFLINWLVSVPAFAVPFALATLGLIITEKSGVLSLGAEGFLLIGALVGIGAAFGAGLPPELALIAGALAASTVSLLFALLVIVLRINQVIAGLAIVFFCQGLTGLIATQRGWTNKMVSGLQPLPLGPLADLPLVGRILFNHDILVYLTLPIFAAVVYVLNHTMMGLRIRAVGENPEAADAAGLNVVLYRLGAIMIGSALVGLAGSYLSVAVAKIWVDGMSGGRGWIAVALVIFARWHPWRALAGAILFGFIEALIPRIAALGIRVPQYFILMTPYLATLAVMIWTSRSGGSGRQPAALGIAHVREQRR